MRLFKTDVVPLNFFTCLSVLLENRQEKISINGWKIIIITDHIRLWVTKHLWNMQLDKFKTLILNGSNQREAYTAYEVKHSFRRFL